MQAEIGYHYASIDGASDTMSGTATGIEGIAGEIRTHFARMAQVWKGDFQVAAADFQRQWEATHGELNNQFTRFGAALSDAGTAMRQTDSRLAGGIGHL